MSRPKRFGLRATSEQSHSALDDVLAQRVNVVYYIQWADRIKIGTSANLPSRLRALTYDRLLAIEPGSHALEHMRHLEFRAHRVRGEWFANAKQLRDHIDRIVALHGDPRATYVKWLVGDAPWTEVLDIRENALG